jgi:hypothetical protein
VSALTPYWSKYPRIESRAGAAAGTQIGEDVGRVAQRPFKAAVGPARDGVDVAVLVFDERTAAALEREAVEVAAVDRRQLEPGGGGDEA